MGVSQLKEPSAEQGKKRRHHGDTLDALAGQRIEQWNDHLQTQIKPPLSGATWGVKQSRQGGGDASNTAADTKKFASAPRRRLFEQTIIFSTPFAMDTNRTISFRHRGGSNRDANI